MRLQTWKATAFCAVLLILIKPSTTLASFQDHYWGIQYSVNGSNGEVMNDMASISIEYQKAVDFLNLFPTDAPYKWYLDLALGAMYYDLEDPLQYMGITNTPQSTADLKATNFFFEIGFSRFQEVNSFIQWTLGTRVGGFGVLTSEFRGETDVAQPYHVESSTSLGLTISAFSGIAWQVSDNYFVRTELLLRKFYQAEFAAKETISGMEYKYPDYTSIGFALTVSRGF